MGARPRWEQVGRCPAGPGLEAQSGAQALLLQLQPRCGVLELPGVLLGDLGLSRQLSEGQAVGQTKVGTQVGTPPYMSPELVQGREYGTSSDIWAVGVVLFEILHGRPPFYGANLEQLETRIRAVSHAPFDAGVSAGAKGLVHKSPPVRYHEDGLVVNRLVLKVDVPGPGQR